MPGCRVPIRAPFRRREIPRFCGTVNLGFSVRVAHRLCCKSPTFRRSKAPCARSGPIQLMRRSARSVPNGSRRRPRERFKFDGSGSFPQDPVARAHWHWRRLRDAPRRPPVWRRLWRQVQARRPSRSRPANWKGRHDRRPLHLSSPVRGRAVGRQDPRRAPRHQFDPVTGPPRAFRPRSRLESGKLVSLFIPVTFVNQPGIARPKRAGVLNIVRHEVD